jgi:PKD repeat protein
MTTRRLQNENANAEILGVVILIGIFAITAGIISATILATPEPVKVPAASIEITNSSENTLRVTHSGGDSLALDHLVLRGKIAGAPLYIDGSTNQSGFESFLVLETDPSLDDGSIDNGFINSKTISTTAGDALVLSWRDNGGGESVIASWDPSGIYGPLGPSTPSGGSVLGTPYVPAVQPTWQTPNTSWNATLHNVTAGFTVNPTAAIGGFYFEFTDASTGNVTIDSWLWNFGDGNTSTEHNVTHNAYGAMGTYTVTLTVSNKTFGVSDTIAKPGCVQVTGSPGSVDFDFNVSHPSGSTTLIVNCTDRSTSSPTLWRWTAKDGINDTAPYSTGWLQLNSTNMGVNYIDKNTPYDPRHPVFTFENPSATKLDPCMVTLEIDSPYFERPMAVTKTVYVGPPQAEFSSNLTHWTGVSPLDVQFYDTSLGGPADTWSWNFGDGSALSTLKNPVHTFTVGASEIRTFTVSLTVTGWGKSNTTNHDITVYPPVIARIASNVSAGPAPLYVQFTDQSTGSPTNWLWDFGDGSTSTLQNPSHTFTKEGRYNVTLFVERATDPHSADLKTFPVYIRVGAPVTANFSGTPVNGTAPLAVTFTDLSTSADPIISWAWDFDSNGVIDSTVQNPSWTYPRAGRYSVTLTAGNSNRVGTITKVAYITVYEHVKANFTADQRTGMIPLTVRFTDTSTGNPTNWLWNFGDGTTSTARDPVHTYSVGDRYYNVTLTASHAFSSDTMTKIAYIYAATTPNDAKFTANRTAGPAPFTVQFTDTSVPLPTAWNWNFGDGTWFNTTIPADRSPTHTYTANGTYSVTLTATQPGGPITSRPVNITVYTPIVARMSVFNNDGMVPLAVSFTDTSIGDRDRWSWQFGDLTPNSTELNPVHSYTAGGIYTANLTVWNSLRPDLTYTASATVMAYAATNAAFTTNVSSGIAPFAVKFTDTSTGNPTWWIWDFNNDGIADSIERNPTHVFTETGNYLVTLRVGNPAGEDPTPATHTIVVSEVRKAAFRANVTGGPAPLAVQFTDESTGDGLTAWTWGFGDGTGTSTVQNPVHTYTTAGTYTVSLTVMNATGSDSEVKTGYITVMYAPVLPVAAFGANITSGIAPLWVQLTDLSTGNPTNWSWDFNNDGVTDSYNQNPVVNYADAGTYTVKLTAANADGSDEEVKTGYITVIDPSATMVITATAGAGGTISPVGPVSVAAGSTRTFAIAPNTGYHILNVTVDGVAKGAITNYTFTNVLANHTIAASFAINTFTITPSNGNPGKGTITPNTAQTVNYGASCLFTMVNGGKAISDVKIDGVSISPVPTSPYPYTFTNVTTNHTIYVNFG